MPSDLLRRAGMEQYVGLDVSQEQTDDVTGGGARGPFDPDSRE
jgi:hypothetical protein